LKNNRESTPEAGSKLTVGWGTSFGSGGKLEIPIK
jgi:hypothetical protein